MLCGGLRAPFSLLAGVYSILTAMEEKPWETLARRYLHTSPWFSFRLDDVRLPDGARIEYGVLEAGGFAAMVALTDEGKLVLVRQYRQPLGEFTLELPGGGVDGGDPGEAARRELAEETGYRGEDVERLGEVSVSSGRSTEVCHLFRCRAVKEGEPQPGFGEFIRVVEVPFEEAVERVLKGEMGVATTALGILWTASAVGG